MREGLKWRRVTREFRCPICGKDSWCLVGAEVALCMRSVSERPHLLADGSEGYLHRLTDAPRQLPEPSRPEPTINATKLMEEWSSMTKIGCIQRLSHDLGVSITALVELNCVWAAPHHAFGFPMREGSGQIVGIRLRTLDGRKFAVKGSHQGLFIPCGKRDNTAYICEGPTDTAAALSVGLYAVGRPSCSGGMRDLPIAFRRLGVRRAVIISDNDDPGLRGAEMLSRHLGIPTATLVLPCKDMREFVKSGGTPALLASILKNTVWNIPHDEHQ